MSDDRHAHPDYAKDVDMMILEYLIYSAMKGCIEDFEGRRVDEITIQASESVLTQLHILDGETSHRLANDPC